MRLTFAIWDVSVGCKSWAGPPYTWLPFYRRGSWCSEGLRKLPSVSQALGSESVFGPRGRWLRVVYSGYMRTPDTVPVSPVALHSLELCWLWNSAFVSSERIHQPHPPPTQFWGSQRKKSWLAQRGTGPGPNVISPSAVPFEIVVKYTHTHTF